MQKAFRDVLYGVMFCSGQIIFDKSAAFPLLVRKISVNN